MSYAPNPETRGEWTGDDRDRAVTLFLQTGSLYQVQQITKIPKTTLQDWKKSDWWLEVVRQLRDEGNAVQEQKMTELLDVTMAKLKQRVDNGDEVVTKEGEIVQVPLKARDLAYIAQVLFDRRQLLRGGNVVVEQTSEKDLTALTRAFTGIAKELQRSHDDKVVLTIEGEKICE